MGYFPPYAVDLLSTLHHSDLILVFGSRKRAIHVFPCIRGNVLTAPSSHVRHVMHVTSHTSRHVTHVTSYKSRHVTHVMSRHTYVMLGHTYIMLHITSHHRCHVTDVTSRHRRHVTFVTSQTSRQGCTKENARRHR